MAFTFDPSKAKAPTRIVESRQECTTYESAMSYIKDRVEEQRKTKKWTWIQEDKIYGLVVTVTLKTMPIYWSSETTGRKITIYNPDGSVYQERDELAGMSRYPVASQEEGIEMLELLASGSNEVLNERVRAASAAYAEVQDKELPDINTKAEMLYNESSYKGTLGAWGEPDEAGAGNRMRISKAKTNKMNQYKQTARRQLGYARWNDTLKVHKS